MQWYVAVCGGMWWYVVVCGGIHARFMPTTAASCLVRLRLLRLRQGAGFVMAQVLSLIRLTPSPSPRR